MGKNSAEGLNQGAGSISLGENSGRNNQGDYSTCIGYNAGVNGCPADTILLSSGNTGFSVAGTTGGFYVNNVMNATNDNVMYYDPSTFQITYGTSTNNNTIRFSSTSYYPGIGSDTDFLNTRRVGLPFTNANVTQVSGIFSATDIVNQNLGQYFDNGLQNLPSMHVSIPLTGLYSIYINCPIEHYTLTGNRVIRLMICKSTAASAASADVVQANTMTSVFPQDSEWTTDGPNKVSWSIQIADLIQLTTGGIISFQFETALIGGGASSEVGIGRLSDAAPMTAYIQYVSA